MPPRLHLFSSGVGGGKSFTFRSTRQVVGINTTTGRRTLAHRQQPIFTKTAHRQQQQQQQLVRCISSSSSSSAAVDEKNIQTKTVATEQEQLEKEGEERSAKGPNQDQLPHVSEEAGAMADITGEEGGGPDLQQATSVQEIFERDEDAKEKVPKILKQEKAQPESQYTSITGNGGGGGNGSGSGSRSYSTSAVRRSPDLVESSSVTSSAPGEFGFDTDALQTMVRPATPEKGTKFGIPERPFDRTDHLRHRYHPVIEQLTKLMMTHGKLASAQRNLDIILDHLRTAPPPKPSMNVFPILQSYYSPPVTGYIPPHAPKHVQKQLANAANGISNDNNNRTANSSTTTTTMTTTRSDRNTPRLPSLPQQLDPSLLPLDPVTYLTLAIDSVAPLIKVRQQRNVLGGGASLQIPVPLPLKQRRRAAIVWILAASDKRKEVCFADRVARELVNVVEGKSAAWTRREGVHRMGIGARSNVRIGGGGGGKGSSFPRR